MKCFAFLSSVATFRFDLLSECESEPAAEALIPVVCKRKSRAAPWPPPPRRHRVQEQPAAASSASPLDVAMERPLELDTMVSMDALTKKDPNVSMDDLTERELNWDDFIAQERQAGRSVGFIPQNIAVEADFGRSELFVYTRSQEPFPDGVTIAKALLNNFVETFLVVYIRPNKADRVQHDKQCSQNEFYFELTGASKRTGTSMKVELRGQRQAKEEEGKSFTRVHLKVTSSQGRWLSHNILDQGVIDIEETFRSNLIEVHIQTSHLNFGILGGMVARAFHKVDDDTVQELVFELFRARKGAFTGRVSNRPLPILSEQISDVLQVAAKNPEAFRVYMCE